MRKEFISRLNAINWMANNTEDEGQFEVWREQFTFNFIYTGQYFLNIAFAQKEVVWMSKE